MTFCCNVEGCPKKNHDYGTRSNLNRHLKSCGIPHKNSDAYKTYIANQKNIKTQNNIETQNNDNSINNSNTNIDKSTTITINNDNRTINNTINHVYFLNPASDPEIPPELVVKIVDTLFSHQLLGSSQILRDIYSNPGHMSFRAALDGKYSSYKPRKGKCCPHWGPDTLDGIDEDILDMLENMLYPMIKEKITQDDFKHFWVAQHLREEFHGNVRKREIRRKELDIIAKEFAEKPRSVVDRTKF